MRYNYTNGTAARPKGSPTIAADLPGALPMAVHAEKHGRPRLEQHWRNHHTAHSFPASATSSFPFVIQINVEYNICIDSCVFHTRPQFPERRPPVARGATPIQYDVNHPITDVHAIQQHGADTLAETVPPSACRGSRRATTPQARRAGRE